MWLSVRAWAPLLPLPFLGLRGMLRGRLRGCGPASMSASAKGGSRRGRWSPPSYLEKHARSPASAAARPCVF